MINQIEEFEQYHVEGGRKKKVTATKANFPQLEETLGYINEITAVSDTEERYNSDESPIEVSAKVKPIEVKPKLKKQKKIIIKIDINEKKGKTTFPELSTKQEELKLRRKNKQKMRKARAAQKLRRPNEELTQEDLEKIKAKKEKNLKQKEKKLAMKHNQEAQKHPPIETGINSSKNSSKEHDRQCNSEHKENLKRKLQVVNGDKEYRKPKARAKNSTIEIGGKKVELTYFGSFLIKKKDADELYHLRNQMRKQGVPQSDIKATLQLERRKAEKALEKEKRNAIIIAAGTLGM